LESADSENYSIAAGLSDSEVNLPVLKTKGAMCSPKSEVFQGEVIFLFTRPLMGDPEIFLGL